MSPTTTRGTTYWVCIDCYYAHHGVAGYEADDREYVPDREPLSLIPEGSIVLTGLMWHEHSEECANHRTWPNEECECERTTFSKSSCDGCGSTLAGARESLTVFTLDDEEV
jgi:hypothetical protein